MAIHLLADAGGAPADKLYEVIIEGAPVMLWMGDATGRCVFLNRRQREFWGVTREAVSSFDWGATLHPDDSHLVAEKVGAAMAAQSAMEVEARFRRASDGAWRRLRTTAEPRFDAAGKFAGMVGVNIDVTEQRLAEADLRRARDAIALATRSSQLGWASWEYGGAAELDARAREILGASETEEVGWGWVARMPPEDRVNLEGELRRSAGENRPYNLIFRITTAAGDERRVQASGMVEADADGTPLHGTGLLRDVTDEWREEEFQRLLVQELSHRNKNLLSVVTALVNQTPTADRSAAEFRDAITGRLAALAAGMEATAGPDSSVFDVRSLAETVLAPFREADLRRVALDGEGMQIDAGYARSLGLVLHELATNAAKHGALAAPEGRVTLDWRRETGADGDRFVMSWCERGGPPPAPGGRSGFGTRLLQNLVALETGGTARYDLTPAGLDYELSFAL